MSEITALNNILYWPIKRGVSNQIVIINPSGWAMFSLIVMDVKEENSLDAKIVMRFTVGDGFTIDGVNLVIDMTAQRAKLIKARNYACDIKCMIGDEVLDPIQIVIKGSETVTNTPS